MGGLYENLSGAKGLRAEGRSAQNLAEYTAQVEEQQAKAVRAKTKFEQRRQAKAGERVKSALRARLGAAGAEVSAGTPLLLSAVQAAELELENLLIGYEGEVAARRAESQAVLDRLQGKLARQRGKSAARQANIQFGMQTASLLTGFA